MLHKRNMMHKQTLNIRGNIGWEHGPVNAIISICGQEESLFHGRGYGTVNAISGCWHEERSVSEFLPRRPPRSNAVVGQFIFDFIICWMLKIKKRFSFDVCAEILDNFSSKWIQSVYGIYDICLCNICIYIYILLIFYIYIYIWWGGTWFHLLAIEWAMDRFPDWGGHSWWGQCIIRPITFGEIHKIFARWNLWDSIELWLLNLFC